MKNLLAMICAAVILSAGVVGCSRDDSDEATPLAPSPVATADLSGNGPGTLVSASTMPAIDRKIKVIGAQAVRVVYRSTSGVDGSPTEVSGAVFVPIGVPPPGGWPIFAYAHGTTGIEQGCAPSLSPNVYGAVDLIVQYLKLGFAVAAPDYQGLGTPGPHPYLDAKTAGLNVIDAVRALRHVSTKVSNVWTVFGGSQGGGAAWAANEQATDATDLRLIGSISLSPALDVVGYAAAAASRTLTRDQQATYIWILAGIARTHPDFNLDDYRRGVARDKWDVLLACQGPQTDERARILATLSPDDLAPATPEAEERLAAILQTMAVPQRPAAAPMFVVYGGQDAFINPDWTRSAIDRGCAMGDVIEATFEPNSGHGNVDGSQYVQWLGERLAGSPPAPNNCPPVTPSEDTPDGTSGDTSGDTSDGTSGGTESGTSDGTETSPTTDAGGNSTG